MKLTGDIRRDFDKVTAENAQLKDRILGYQEQIHDLRRSLSKVQKSKDSLKAAYEEQLAEKDATNQPEIGRFTAEDVVKGNGAYPETLNSYAYCMGNPMSYVDLNGESPEDYIYTI